MRVTCNADPELDNVLLAVPVGRLNAEGANRFWEVVGPRMSERAPSVLVDMTRVDWMSSAGVGILMRTLSRLRPLGGKLAIFGCSPNVERVFEICQLKEMLNVSASPDDARRRITD
jgi:anti-anti-sigma factor